MKLWQSQKDSKNANLCLKYIVERFQSSMFLWLCFFLIFAEGCVQVMVLVKCACHYRRTYFAATVWSATVGCIVHKEESYNTGKFLWEYFYSLLVHLFIGGISIHTLCTNLLIADLMSRCATTAFVEKIWRHFVNIASNFPKTIKWMPNEHLAVDNEIMANSLEYYIALMRIEMFLWHFKPIPYLLFQG